MKYEKEFKDIYKTDIAQVCAEIVATVASDPDLKARDLGEFSDTLHTLKDEIEGRAQIRQMITTLERGEEL